MVCRLLDRVFVFVFASAAPALAGNVWIVDSAMGPGAQFAEIQPAVNAASSGDLILVRSGSYQFFSSGIKGVAICADAGASVQLAPTGFAIASTPAGLQTWVHGFGGGRAIVQSNDGRVLLSQCSFVGLNPNSPAIDLLSADEVILDEVTAIGAPSAPTVLAGTGLLVFGGVVAAYGCSFSGGAGVDATATTAGGNGGTGAKVFVNNSTHFSNCTVQGGKGGNGSLSGGCQAPGAGGTGLSVSLNAFTSQCTFIGGAGGTAAAGCGANGADGPGISGPSTNLVQRPTLDVTTIVREGQQGTVQTSTQPGLNIVLIGSLQAFQPVPPFHGLLHVADPVLLVTMPPSGFVSYTVSELGAGVPFVALRAQAAHADPLTQSVELGQTCGVLLLDSAY